MTFEEHIVELVNMTERLLKEAYKEKFKSMPKPPVEELFLASAMSEVARRLRSKAASLEENWTPPPKESK